jgi:hypothetical protein
MDEVQEIKEKAQAFRKKNNIARLLIYIRPYGRNIETNATSGKDGRMQHAYVKSVNRKQRLKYAA